MRKVFLENLPRWENGRYKGNINWKESVGYKVRFIYDEIEGEIEIVDYIKKNNKAVLKLIYKENEFIYNIKDFADCKICRLLGKRNSNFKIEISSIISDDKRDMIIIDREYRRTSQINSKNKKVYYTDIKWYKYHCNKCGNEDWMNEGHLTKNRGCNACGGGCAKPKLGINTIWDTDRWMCDLGVSAEDAKKHTKGSEKFIISNCPLCGNNRRLRVCDIHRYKSIGCKCGDDKSYPEKFMFNLLKQLNINFETEKVFDWSNQKRYDFYIPNSNIIIEIHGEQHYKGQRRKGSKSLQEEQDNDKYKEELAIKNNINEYIIINAEISDIDWIKNNILNSKLNNIFNLSNVDWLKCEEFALKNIVKEVCYYWNNKEEHENTGDLEIHFKINRGTLINYLKKGAKLGWCNYNTKEELIKRSIKVGKMCGKQVEIFKDNTSLGIFPSCAELERQSEDLFGVKLGSSMISHTCLGVYKQYKGFNFQYA